MNCLHRIALLVLISLPLRGEILLKGIMIADGAPVFSLYSTEDQTSKWVSLGQSFAGFQAIYFDPSHDTLTVARGERRVELTIASAKIRDASASPRSAETPPKNVLRIAASGLISTMNGSFTVEKIEDVAASLDKDSVVRIEMDPHANASVGIAVLNAVRKAGATRVTVGAEEKP